MMKKAIYWVWFAVLATPAVMCLMIVPNIGTNVMGIIYCLLIYKYWNKLTTKSMRQYFDKISEDQ